jgi:hypothetical protein
MLPSERRRHDLFLAGSQGRGNPRQPQIGEIPVQQLRLQRIERASGVHVGRLDAIDVRSRIPVDAVTLARACDDRNQYPQ